MNTKPNNPSRDDQRMQALLRAALRPALAEAPPAELVERIVRATVPRLRRSRSVLGRIGVAAGWWAAAACVAVVAGLGSYWMRDRTTSVVAWRNTDETRIAQFAQADVPQEGVELGLRTLALAVQDAQDNGRENWDRDEIGESWMRTEAEVGVF